MTKKVKCIMLIDDNPDDNFVHKRIIQKNDAAANVVVKESGPAALDFLKEDATEEGQRPELIFLDINMPNMNGWEFLDEYSMLDKGLQSKAVIIMLTTSDNPDDRERAKKLNISADFKTKPLTKEILDEVLSKYS